MCVHKTLLFFTGLLLAISAGTGAAQTMINPNQAPQITVTTGNVSQPSLTFSAIAGGVVVSTKKTVPAGGTNDVTTCDPGGISPNVLLDNASTYEISVYSTNDKQCQMGRVAMMVTQYTWLAQGRTRYVFSGGGSSVTITLIDGSSGGHGLLNHPKKKVKKTNHPK